MLRLPITLLPPLIALVLIVSCTKPARKGAPEAAPQDPPVGLIVEREISGPVLGRALNSPFGLAISAEDFIYCVDQGNNRLIKFRPDLTPIGDVGGAGSAAGLLNRPGFVTIDNELNLFVADEGNQRISRFNSDLLFVDEIGFYDPEEPVRFGEPSGVAVSAHGEIWVADRQRNRIAVFNNVGEFDRFVGDFGYRGGQVKSPEAILVDESGNFNVCDAGNGRVIVYDQYGSEVRQVRNSAFNYPTSAIPLGKEIWVVDGADGILFCLDEQGEILFMIGPNIPGSSQPLREPSDITMLPDDRLLIADTGNNRLLVCRVLRGSE